MSQIDPGRLRRAIHLEVEALERGRWRVTGGSAAHGVVVEQDQVRCDCADQELHPDLMCKHVAAVILQQLPLGIRQGLRALVGP